MEVSLSSAALLGTAQQQVIQMDAVLQQQPQLALPSPEAPGPRFGPDAEQRAPGEYGVTESGMLVRDAPLQQVRHRDRVHGYLKMGSLMPHELGKRSID